MSVLSRVFASPSEWAKCGSKYLKCGLLLLLAQAAVLLQTSALDGLCAQTAP